MSILKTTTLCALTFGLLAFAPAPSFALEDDDAPAEEAAEDEGPEVFVIQGADVYTGTGAVLKGATLVSTDGKITDLGYDVDVPDDAEVLQADGYRVYPGLVAVSSIGLFGGGTPTEDAVDPFSRTMTLAVGGGVLASVNGSEVAKLKRGHIDDLVINQRPFQSLSYSKRSPSGKRALREKFDKAAAWLRSYRQWEIDVRSNKELKEPKKSGVDTGVLDVLMGKKRAYFSASERTDLLEIARLAQKYEFRPVINGAREGWTVASELGRAGASIILTPRERRSPDEARVGDNGSSIENAARLYAAGCEIAIVPSSRGVSLDGIAGRDMMHLPVEAAFAIRGGLPEDAALAAITRVPARLLGVSHRIGTVEVGKDCDLIITDGDVLHYKSWVQWAVIDGEIIYDKEAEMFFAHIRPRPETELAPVDPVDAGEGDEDVVEAPADGDGEDSGEEGDGDSGDGPEEGSGEDGEGDSGDGGGDPEGPEPPR